VTQKSDERRVASEPVLERPRDSRRFDRVFTIDLRLLGLSESTVGARLLDLGCGAGRHELAAAKLPILTTGCDLSRKDLSDGRFFVGEDGRDGGRPGLTEWVQGSGHHLPFADGAFDAAICSETLEHVEDDRGVLRELHRVVKAEGTLGVSVPAYLVERILWQLSWEVSHTPGGHIRIYRRPELLGKLRQTGWLPYAVRYRHAFESVYWLLGAVGGGTTPPWRPARMWRSFTNSAGVRESGRWDAVERKLSRPIGKSLVVYARSV
jgi:SAM-dependent methyltransferase